MKKIGIFGGTFNPVHIGHFRLAIEVLEQTGLDQIEFMPASIPPHKPAKGILPFSFRKKLLQKTLADQKGLAVNDLEARLNGTSYTYKTVNALLAERQQTEFYFLLGTNDLPDMPNWEEGMHLPYRINFIIVERLLPLAEAMHFAQTTWRDCKEENANEENGKNSKTLRFPEGKKMLFLAPPKIAISSTLIRKKWLQGKSVDFLLPQSILDELQAQKETVDACWGNK